MPAKCLFSAFILEHNLPINCADHENLAFKKMFSDSAIAKKKKKNACAWTKTTSIIGEMGISSRAELINAV